MGRFAKHRRHAELGTGVIELQPHSSEAIGRQVSRQIRSLIERDLLEPGARLPSCTDMGKQLRINRLTVAKAYQQLESQGLIEKRRGVGSFVSARIRRSPAKKAVSLVIGARGRGDDASHYEMVPQMYLEGISECLSERDVAVNLVIIPPDQIESNEPHWLEKIKSNGGMIFVSSQFGALLRKLAADLPFVQCRTLPEKIEGVSFVDYDRRAAFRLATEHIISRGCRRLTFMGCKNVRNGEFSPKLAGFIDALEEAGLPYLPDLRIDCPESSLMIPKFQGLAAQALAKKRVGDGVVCGGYGMACAVAQVLNDAGVKVPQEVKIISADDSLEAEFNVPSLSALRIPRFELGRAAAELLLELMESPDSAPLERWVKPALVLRRSTEVEARVAGRPAQEVQANNR